jgi:dienelactone hydrolase
MTVIATIILPNLVFGYFFKRTESEGMKGPNMDVSRNHQAYYGQKNSGILEKKVGRLSCPILIVHSDVHQINDVNNAYLIPKIRAQGKDLETILYPGLDHGFYWGQGWAGVTEAVFDKVVSDIKAYLDQHLRTKPVPIQRG